MTFEAGTKVVYPNQGVCEIRGICDRNIAGRKEEFYLLRILSNDSTVMIPVSNVENVGLRPLCEKSELKRLFEILQSDDEEPDQDWKNRYKDNVERMKTGCIFEVGRVLQKLHFLGFQKPLSFREKKMYDRARQLVVSEIATVSSKGAEEVEAMVEGMLTEAFERVNGAAPTV